MDIETIKSNLLTVIKQFNDNRANILSAANQQGGQDAVAKLEANFDDLNNQYDQLLEQELDVNNAAYSGLSDQADSETTQLQASLSNLQDINQTITLCSSVISTVASIVTMV